MQSSEKIPSNYGTELENLEKNNSSLTSKLKPLLTEKSSTNQTSQTSTSLPIDPIKAFSPKVQSTSLSQTYMHYSNNLYQLLDGGSESPNNFTESSSFRSNFLLTSLSATEKIQVSKKLIPQTGNQSVQRTIRFFIESCGEDPGNDPFQSEGFSVELTSAGGLNFSYKPKDNQSTAIEEYRPNQGSQPCAEIIDRDRIFTDTDDKFLVISFWTQEKNINLGNLRHLKNKYQIFNPAGVPMYEIPEMNAIQGMTNHRLFIFDANREKVASIDFNFDDQTTMKAETIFTDKVRPKDKLLVLGAVFMIIAKISFSKPNGKAEEEECNMGCFVSSVVKKFCNAG